MSELAARIESRLALYSQLTRFGRPIGTFLLLWPTLWAVWIAGRGSPEPYVALVFFVGVFVMRAAGCVVNDFADRGIDGHVKRTRDRPLATGQVSEREALGLFAALVLAAFALVLTLNRLTIYLAFAGLALAVIYPFLKRYTHLPQLGLSLAFSWGIPMAFAAETGAVPAVAWWLVAANACWVMAYDTMYAMVDRDDDLKIGVKSTAVLFGNRDLAVIGASQILTIVILWLVGVQLERGGYYLGGLAAAAIFAAYQQWRIRGRDRDACFSAFLNNTWFGAAIFGGIVLDML